MENKNINTNATDTQMNSTNESKSESFANEALTANTNYGTISSADIENGTAELVLMKTSDADSISNFESPPTEVSINQFYEGCITNPTECLIFKFVPPQNGMYTVHTIGNLNTLGKLYFEDTEEPIMTSDNSPRDNKNFRMERWLYKQRTYYIKVSSVNSETGCFHIRVTDDVLVSSVDMVPSVTMRVGDTLDLSSITTVCPSNATNKNVNYTCSDSCVATIMQTANRDDNGIITYTSTLSATAPGVVTVKAFDFDGYGEIGECKIYVSNIIVISCSPEAWLSSSTKMGQDMANAFGYSDRYDVLSPNDAISFENAWNAAHGCLVIHTHGSNDGLFDEYKDENGETHTPLIISKDNISNLAKNDRLCFVMVTACKTASGISTDNVAYWLSKKINSNGIVIANTDTVLGADTDFYGKSGMQTWKIYKNGVIQDKNIPVSLNMQKAYEIYRTYL